MRGDLESKVKNEVPLKLEALHLISWGGLLISSPIQVGTAYLSGSPSGLEGYVSKAGGGFSSILLGVIAYSVARRAQHIISSEKRLDNGERELVTEGIYSSIRHPIYLSFRLISIAAVFYNPSVETLMGAGAVFGISGLTARIEEKKMMLIYPKEYREYNSNTPRWIPHLNNIGLFAREIGKYFSTVIRNPSKW